jgi:Flp pilus assembly protein TadD
MKGRMFVVSLWCVGVLFVSSVAAQFDAGNMIRRIKVRVVGNGACGLSAHVTLVGHGGPIAESATNDQCEVEFFNVPEGSYHLNVNGQGFQAVDSGSIQMMSTGSTDFEVRVQSTNVQHVSAADGNFGTAASGFVSASDLGVPSRARKEFDRANELIGKEDLPQAIEKLNRAVSIYPNYAVAYNNLGVIYGRLGDSARERDALLQALKLNDHFALAYVNVGRMNIMSGDYSGAETALDKASAFDPTDPNALILLSWAQFNERHFDEAIATCRKAHALEKPHAFVHRVAARSFEQLRQGPNAIAELEQFLKEEPPGPRADAARKELETVRTSSP